MTKRNIYRVAGEIFPITRTLSEANALGHANVARKLAGREKHWDKAIDFATAEAAAFHLHEAIYHWNNCLEEELQLLYKVRKIRIETDASLSGSGFACVDPESGRTLFAEAFIATPAMKVEEWHCNRCELNGILQALRRLTERLDHLSALESVLVQTDSRVAAAHCDVFSRPHSGNLEKGLLIRIAAVIHNLIEELDARGTRVAVSHIAGIANTHADQLSRIPDVGGYQDLVFNKVTPGYRSEEDPQKTVTIHRMSTVELARDPLDPDLTLLSLPAFEEWRSKYIIFHSWRAGMETGGTTTPKLLLQFIRSVQTNDPYCQQVKKEVAEGKSRRLFELHEGIVFLREPVATNYPQDGWKNQPLRLLLPAKIAKEYATLIHRQCGHLGLHSTIARCRQNIDCTKFRRVT